MTEVTTLRAYSIRDARKDEIDNLQRIAYVCEQEVLRSTATTL